MILKRFRFLYFLLMLVLVTTSSCEKDDVCLAPMTPNLVMRMYNISIPEDINPVDDLTMIALPGLDTIYKNKTLDSLSIPLNVNADNCRFAIISDHNTDTIVYSYQRNFVFVSKTCGYKTTFSNLQVNFVVDSDNWIKNISIIQPEIIRDTTAHVKVFH